MIDTLEVGAVNEVDESYKAMVTGYSDHKAEIWIEDTMEVIEHQFGFGLDLAACRSDAPDHAEQIAEYARTDRVTSAIFGELVGLDARHIFDVAVYGRRRFEKEINHELDESLIKGKEIGVIIGDYFGRRIIKAFIPLSELSTMPVPD